MATPRAEPLACDDKRNPTYYVLRTGHPFPEKAWFENRNSKGERTPMLWSKEAFVRGFNITTGQFHELRKSIISDLQVLDIMDGGKKLNSYDMKWDPTVISLIYYTTGFPG
ncbi:hypothetical protein BDV95DRAFT_171630 [Massariosphaeria phaeospora]|uniref:Uncharacterized protein n=1 Tax=Massariosphaeria phaeospora TaxID=100035 RepID=A0A7C8MEP3_9PLEO|nr:hypothetical protein BDV95DRAFT_171630 [Massariosphaeria phaeospora]